jgi:SPOR domain
MASTLRILKLFLRESHASRSNDKHSCRNPAKLISKADAFGNERMIMRSQFYQLALEANEKQGNVGDDILPVPTLDERVTLYLRAIHGNREFTEEERSNARNALLDSMATEIAAQGQPEVAERRPLHPYEAAAKYSRSVQHKAAIRVVPIARRRTSILALTATLGLVLIAAGGTLGYRWTHPHIGEEVSGPSQQDRVPLPTTSPRSLWTPGQHVVQIASQRSEADVLAVFRRLQQEKPTLFGQAILKHDGEYAVGVSPTGDPTRYTAKIGPFASEKDTAAACLALAAAVPRPMRGAYLWVGLNELGRIFPLTAADSTSTRQ